MQKYITFAAKGVGHAFTGGRDLNFFLHNLNAAVLQLESYLLDSEIQKILPPTLREWGMDLVGEGKEVHSRIRAKLEGMEKGVRGAAESSLHAISSAAGALTGVAALDLGRMYMDEMLNITLAINDLLAKATRVVLVATTHMMAQMTRAEGREVKSAAELCPAVVQAEMDTVHPRIWVYPVQDHGLVVAGETLIVSWRTIGVLSDVNVRLKDAILGIDTGRGKTVFRLTDRFGEPNGGTIQATIPTDFPAGKYTAVVSSPNDQVRGATLVTIVRPISVMEILSPPSGSALKSIGLGAVVRSPVWHRGSTHLLVWKMCRAKQTSVQCTISVSTREEGPWMTLEGAACLTFHAPAAPTPLPTTATTGTQNATSATAGTALSTSPGGGPHPPPASPAKNVHPFNRATHSSLQQHSYSSLSELQHQQQQQQQQHEHEHDQHQAPHTHPSPSAARRFLDEESPLSPAEDGAKSVRSDSGRSRRVQRQLSDDEGSDDGSDTENNNNKIRSNSSGGGGNNNKESGAIVQPTVGSAPAASSSSWWSLKSLVPWQGDGNNNNNNNNAVAAGVNISNINHPIESSPRGNNNPSNINNNNNPNQPAIDTSAILCEFEWRVPHELRPGRYTIRFTPIVNSEIRTDRSRDSAAVLIQ